MIIFDVDSVQTVEFGVGRDAKDPSFVRVPADSDVTDALCAMVRSTIADMENSESTEQYEPSEKYANPEYLQCALDQDYASAIREVHEPIGLTEDRDALADPKAVFCYFTRVSDRSGARLTALRRASQFKGILKSSLMHRAQVTDDYTLYTKHMFKLDAGFDVLVDGETIHIWRPSGFEYLAQLGSEVLAAAGENFSDVRNELPFMDLEAVEAYAGKRIRAARLVAAIRSSGRAVGVHQEALARQCRRTGVGLEECEDGRLRVLEGSEMGFLEVLDRRRYDVELVEGDREAFRAGSRKSVLGQASA